MHFGPTIIPITLRNIEQLHPKLHPRHRKTYPVFYFHILRSVREFYSVEESLFQLSGNVIFANFSQARTLANRMNEKRDTLRFPETAIKAGHINAMGLIDEVLHYVLSLYKERESPALFSTALGHLENRFEQAEIDRLISSFRHLYPSPGKTDATEKEVILEEIVMLWLANTNPAFEPFIELFDHTELRETTIYPKVIEELRGFFSTQPRFGPKDRDIFEMLRAPAIASPRSLSGQLAYMQHEWGMLLGRYLLRMLQSLDFIKEEERPFFSGPGPTHVYTYRGEDEELEHFSQDKEWMPKVVLIAKSVYVWLYQLTKKYGRRIETLDQIPDEEIDRMAARGFSGLWLIGIWERSPASKRIKQLCGNLEAEASAYSLLEYEIAGDLGGWEALHTLKRKCLRRGIRLASDMVPNHTGIDSNWVIKHPDWFIQLRHNPYPQYGFNGEDLSYDDRVNVYIEDHYYDKTDAAVAFKRLDTHTGESRYIYHGNDGTSMPWNDTAQLDFLQAEVREAVIQTILHVARNFSIIRFDAAMTLTKKHFQRLWYPEPGSGGDIPTRAEHGLTKEEFNRAMPVEFWRELVNRIAEEVPDTLLLAEAFWMMEGFFVRTLGMHRVYNSAFMNMLKDEENEKYRNTIKNTQEFDPEILKRFVNFMNNPDEETAIAQFGTDDKYFGVCTLMITMPGLPMFGHGQIEGFTEKYGMEYRRSYYEEEENLDLIRRHEREIFPLIKKRYIFAEVHNFLLYDVYTSDNTVNENVFAYSNRAGDEVALVLYNNSYYQADGWINMSAAFALKKEDGSKQLIQKHLAEGLDIPSDLKTFVIFQEHNTKLWYIRNCKEIWNRGLYLSLAGYEAHIFIDFYTVYDNEYGHYNQLANSLNGKGTKDIKRSLQEVFLQPLHSVFKNIIREETILQLKACITGTEKPDSDFKRLTSEMSKGFSLFLDEAKDYLTDESIAETEEVRAKHLRSWIETVCSVGKALYGENTTHIEAGLAKYPFTPYVFLFLPFFLSLSKPPNCAGVSDQLLLEKPVSDLLRNIADEKDTRQCISITKLLTLIEPVLETCSVKEADELMTALFKHAEVSRFLRENRYNNVLYFHKESFEILLWFLVPFSIMIDVFNGKTAGTPAKLLKKRTALRNGILEAAVKAGYETEGFIENCKEI